jgi:hypothetical protein
VSDETPGTPDPSEQPVPPVPPAAVVPPPPAPVPQAPPVAVPSTPVPPAPPAPVPSVRRRPRWRTAVGVTAAVAVVAAGVVLGGTVLHGHHGSSAGTSAATPWQAPPTPTPSGRFGAKPGGTHYGSLALLLLPMPAGFSPGPDVKAFGNDVLLGAGQARDLVKADTDGMPARDRLGLDAAIDALRIQGAGIRTYTESGGNLVVTISLIQVENQRAAQAIPEFQAAEARTERFRSGPRVKGFPRATCLLAPLEAGERVSEMMCQAAEGDLVVKLTASGTVPLERTEVAELMAHQLDRVKNPGEAV